MLLHARLVEFQKVHFALVVRVVALAVHFEAVLALAHELLPVHRRRAHGPVAADLRGPKGLEIKKETTHNMIRVASNEGTDVGRRERTSSSKTFKLTTYSLAEVPCVSFAYVGTFLSVKVSLSP